jgi:uncharacterized membrane protein
VKERTLYRKQAAAATSLLHSGGVNLNRSLAMMDYGYYGGMMGGLGWLWMALVPVLVLALIAWGARAAFWSRPDTDRSTPMETLRRRYAAGEITAVEFEQAKQSVA